MFMSIMGYRYWRRVLIATSILCDWKLPVGYFSGIYYLVVFALQSVESVYFMRDGREFVSCHGDGSYVTWTTSDASRFKDEPKTTYGLCLLLPCFCSFLQGTWPKVWNTKSRLTIL